MAALYVISPEKGSGKTALAAGLKKLLAVRGKDVNIVEGNSEQYEASRDTAASLKAKIIIVEVYSKDPLKKIEDYKKFGASLLGVVLNKVPKTRLEQVKTEAEAKLKSANINLLGVLPEDRTLLALTIGELSASINGEFLSGTEKSAELVENLMLAALGLDPGPDYFGRKDKKAVILKSERPDIQLAAIQTPTRCLVLVGDTPIQPIVLNEAKSKNILIIKAKGSVPELVATIEGVVAKTGFNTSKLPRLLELIEQRLDLPKLLQGVG